MKHKYVDFREVKSRVTIREVLEHYDLLSSMKEQGDRISGYCPICAGNKPSYFRASISKSCYRCFKCESGGNILDLVAALEECSIRDAALQLAEWFEIEPKSPSPPVNPSRKLQTARREAEEVQKPNPNQESASEQEKPQESKQSSVVNPPLTFELKLETDHPWFEEVGLNPETVEEFGLGYCKKGVLAGRIAFPIRNQNGELIGYGGRWPGEEPPEGQSMWKYPKNLNLDFLVYPLDRVFILEADSLKIVRDPLEVALLWQQGSTDIISIVGSQMSCDKLKRIVQITE